jgi:hypothetical protein
VIAAAVVAIAGSVLVLLGGGVGLISLLVAPMDSTSATQPPFLHAIVDGTIAFILALGTFGVFCGVGLLRLKNWARIATLVWAGIAAVFSALILAVFSFVPIPTPPNADPNLSGLVRASILIFYGFPLAIGVWWLILFNRQSVANQFIRPTGGALDTSGFPAEISAPKPALPLPVAVLGVFLALSSLSILFPLFVPLPVILFGHAIRGGLGVAIWIGSCFLCGAAGIGLLRLKPWSYHLAIALQVFWFLSGVVTLTGGNYPALMHEVMSSVRDKLGGQYPEYPAEQMQAFAYAGLVTPLLLLGFLIYYRSRFLEASAAAGERG